VGLSDQGAFEAMKIDSADLINSSALFKLPSFSSKRASYADEMDNPLLSPDQERFHAWIFFQESSKVRKPSLIKQILRRGLYPKLRPF